MDMNKRLATAAAVVSLVPLIVSCAAGEGEDRKEIKVGGGERGIEAVIIEGPPLASDQIMSDDHAQYARGMTCAECHDVSFDAVTSATRQFILNLAQLPQEAIWEKIVAFLPGRERFVLATVYNNEPTATTVDMVLDLEERVFFVVSERGTEKLLQVKENPMISAARYAGWTVAEGGKKEWRSVQIKARAELITSTDPRFEIALDKYNLVRLSKERARRRFDLIRVTPLQIIYFDTTLSADKYSVYQLWEADTSVASSAVETSTGELKARPCLSCHALENFAQLNAVELEAAIKAIAAGGTAHLPLPASLTDQDLADIAAFLAGASAPAEG